MISNNNAKYVLKFILIFFLFFGVVISVFYYTQGYSVSGKFDQDEILKITDYDYVIDSHKEALAVAKKIVSFEDVLLKREKEKNWKAQVNWIEQQGKSYWRVEFKSQDFIPSFSCVVSLDKDGKELGFEKYCGYNK